MDYNKVEKLSKIIIKEIEDGLIKTKRDIHMRKNGTAKELGLKKVPLNATIYHFVKNKNDPIFNVLKVKPIRSISGVAVIAVMTKPVSCPHGKCSMCPGGIESVFGNTPQSYTGKEPSALRALRNNYDPYLIVSNRIETYFALGHKPEKVELIIMGGTFPSFDEKYQEDVVKYSLNAMNDFSDSFYSNNVFNYEKFENFFELPAELAKENRNLRINEKLLKQKKDCDLLSEQLKNEKSKIKCVAMCFETRPDWCKEKHINRMLELGATRVEIGVQSVYDKALTAIERGHSVNDSIIATKLLKDSFLKVGYHYMLGLPKTTIKEDVEGLKKLFSDQNFRPDSLKIYPCMVLEGTKLYDEWKNGSFNPISTVDSVKAIFELKKVIPPYVRIHRLQRDIPTNFITAGVDKTNLRDEVKVLQDKHSVKCKCIRCREAGISSLKRDLSEFDFELKKIEYDASLGKEIFLSFEDTKQDVLAGFCRLRIPKDPFREEITPNSSGIRELHIFGEATQLGKTTNKGFQHKGFGKKLVEEAEKIAIERFDARKMLVISGIGAREYYTRKLNYSKDGVFVSKKLV